MTMRPWLYILSMALLLAVILTLVFAPSAHEEPCHWQWKLNKSSCDTQR